MLQKIHSGTLIFEKQQMIHGWKDQKDIYQNPLTQANRHKILLKYFFEKQPGVMYVFTYSFAQVSYIHIFLIEFGSFKFKKMPHLPPTKEFP